MRRTRACAPCPLRNRGIGIGAGIGIGMGVANGCGCQDHPQMLLIACAASSQTVESDVSSRARTRATRDRKSTRLNSSHSQISYAVFCLKKKKDTYSTRTAQHTIHIRGTAPSTEQVF